MGEDLVILTYHDKCTGNGIPDELTNGGLSWRVMKWYDLAMGGVASSGTIIGSILQTTVENLSSNVVADKAKIEIYSQVPDKKVKKSDIMVKVSPKEKLPDNTKLHVVVFDKRVNWLEDFNFQPANGQTEMPYVVRDLITDSTGCPFPTTNVGETFVYSGVYIATETIKKPYRLGIVAFLQVEDTKKILALAKSSHSPLDTSTIDIIMNHNVFNKSSVHVDMLGNTLRMKLPLGRTNAMIYNCQGRLLYENGFSIKHQGEQVSLDMPYSSGVLFVKLISKNGISRVVKVPVRK